MRGSIKFVLWFLAALVAIQFLAELLAIAAIGLAVLAIYYHGVYFRTPATEGKIRMSTATLNILAVAVAPSAMAVGVIVAKLAEKIRR